MAITTVFDVASALLDRAPRKTLGTVKLQKLCFYSFGWYAHQTGRALFDESFYAMQKGPVVGELLSAHAGKRTFAVAQLADQFEVRERGSADLDPYVEAVVDAVSDWYGRFSDWELVEQTHKESVWEEAWESRPEESKRGDLRGDRIVDHFLLRELRADEKLCLPDSQVTIADSSWLESLDSRRDLESGAFVSDVTRYLRALTG